MFFRNVCWHSTDYTALYPRRYEVFTTTAVRTSDPTLLMNLWIPWNVGKFFNSWANVVFSRRARLYGISWPG
jgi:hypothetical protein